MNFHVWYDPFRSTIRLNLNFKVDGLDYAVTSEIDRNKWGDYEFMSEVLTEIISQCQNFEPKRRKWWKFW